MPSLLAPTKQSLEENSVPAQLQQRGWTKLALSSARRSASEVGATPYSTLLLLVPRAQSSSSQDSPTLSTSHPLVMGMRSQAVEEGVLPSVPRWTSFCIVKVRTSLWREVSGYPPLSIAPGFLPLPFLSLMQSWQSESRLPKAPTLPMPGSPRHPLYPTATKHPALGFPPLSR